MKNILLVAAVVLVLVSAGATINSYQDESRIAYVNSRQGIPFFVLSEPTMTYKVVDRMNISLSILNKNCTIREIIDKLADQAGKEMEKQEFDAVMVDGSDVAVLIKFTDE